LAEDSRLPSGSAISVTNKQGDAIARYPDPDKWVGKSYPNVPKKGNKSARDTVKLVYGIDGIKRLYAFTPVGGTGDLIVHVGIKREAIWEPANRALRRQLLALGLVAALAILAAWFTSDLFLLKQIRALIQATKQLGAGKLGTRSSLSYDRGELGELARSFDEMAETLEWREAQLRESETERAEPANLLLELIDLVPIPCLILDDSMEIQSGNAMAQSLLSEPHPEAFIGNRLFRFFPDLPRDGMPGMPAHDPSPQHMPAGNVPEVHVLTTNRNGSTYELRISRFGHSGKSYLIVLFKVLSEDRMAS
jgi:PAS domain-containing protein